VQRTKISPEFESGVKGQAHQDKKNEKLLKSSALTMRGNARRALWPYAARSSRRVHCVAAGGDGTTAVHVDGGLRAVLSGADLAGAATPVGKSAHAV